MHLEAGEISSLDLSFLDRATPHVEPLSKPPIEPDVAIACFTISHMLSLDLLSLSNIQKDAFHTTMVVVQSTSLEPEDGAFIFRVLHRASEVFSSIEHVVKENAQVMYELEKLKGKKKKI